MKKLLLTVLLIAGAMATKAQQYMPLLVDHKVWSYEGVDEKHQIRYTDYELNGDTIIGDLTYHKLFRTNVTKRTVTYHSAWREDGKRVYYIDGGKTAERLVFDFGMTIGDKLPDMPEVYLSATSEAKTYHNGETYTFHRLRFANPDGSLKGFQIEGLGGINGLLDASFDWGRIGLDGFSEAFDHCSIDGTTIYDETDTHLFTRDDTESSIKSNSMTDKDCQATPVYDLYGRRMTGHPARGIYLQGGRKIAVR